MYHCISIPSITIFTLRFMKNTNFWLVSLVFMLLSMLEGCGSKVLSGSDVCVSKGSSRYVKEEKTGTQYLPADDGKSLTKAELKAVSSKGFLDKNISSRDLRDTILHFKYLVRNDPLTIKKNMERAGKYLPYMIEIFRKEGLPLELVYLPFVESSFNPLARSYTGVLGIWQITCLTGKHYGMCKNQWIDTRRDPYESTRIAAQHLKRLYNRFNDWHLAITAYNAGEGKLSRALSASKTTSFFELRRRNHCIPEKNRLTEENKQYLPKFLAVCKIIRNLERLGFSAVDTSKTHKLVEVKAGPGTSLKALSKHIGMNWNEFFSYNLAYIKHVTPPNVHSTIYIPHHKVQKAHAFLKRSNKITYADNRKKYKVFRGDTISSIAKKVGVSVAALQQANPNAFPIKPGTILCIPHFTHSPVASIHNHCQQQKVDHIKTTSCQDTIIYHTVKNGDTLYSISRYYNVSQQHLLAANNLLDSKIAIGQKLYIPIDKSSPLAMLKKSSKQQSTKYIVNYKVREGDSLWSIARKFNVPPHDLLALNNLTPKTMIRPGDNVQVVIN